LGGFRQVNTDGQRNEVPLTDEQKSAAKAYALLLGMPEGKIQFSDYWSTTYWPESDFVLIGTDLLPLSKRSKNHNSNFSWKGAIAHELIGHREAHLRNFGQPEELLEEVQASIRAARFAPDLTDLERRDLLRDAIYRLHKRGVLLRSVKHKLHIDRR
jgi:hypothetical protein